MVCCAPPNPRTTAVVLGGPTRAKTIVGVSSTIANVARGRDGFSGNYIEACPGSSFFVMLIYRGVLSTDRTWVALFSAFRAQHSSKEQQIERLFCLDDFRLSDQHKQPE